MVTRRRVLTQGLQAGAALALGGFAGRSLAQQTLPAHADEMTINSAPHAQQAIAPMPPPPASLPGEAEKVSGANSLQAHASKHGLVAGAAVVVRALDGDPAMQKLIAEQYGMIVPEGELKWRALRPAQDQFDFAQSDALFAFAKEHHLLVRGHTMVWHNSVPDWLQNSSKELDVRKLLVDHIHTVAGRYRGRVHSWDVVNEAILPADGREDNLRKSFWFERIGPDYLDIAFRAAREADPQAKLTYNDYGVEYDKPDESVRRAAILSLLRGMQKRNVPLDAVGIQAHIKAGSPFSVGKGLAEYIESVRQLGLEVYLTEMDVNEDDLLFNDVAQRDKEIAKTYHDFLSVALANPAVKNLLTWGVSDRRTWLNDGPTHHRKQPNRPQRSLPFDDAYRPKETFFAIRDCFDARTA
ncbi:MAG: endo-1,4-beta-xylanase [Terracidiphilus sp.]|nr:endo-1,4-beta-xylanase [Terracidiphilus sp.]